jgi:hypothetical protein
VSEEERKGKGRERQSNGERICGRAGQHHSPLYISRHFYVFLTFEYALICTMQVMRYSDLEEDHINPTDFSKEMNKIYPFEVFKLNKSAAPFHKRVLVFALHAGYTVLGPTNPPTSASRALQPENRTSIPGGVAPGINSMANGALGNNVGFIECSLSSVVREDVTG